MRFPSEYLFAFGLTALALPLLSQQIPGSSPAPPDGLTSRVPEDPTHGALGAVPPGTTLHLRLQGEVSSFGSRPGLPVQLLVIQPVELNHQIVLPLGAEVRGTVTKVRRIGLGFGSETALVALDLTEIRVQGGGWRSASIRVSAIDNSRERVDAAGQIHGVRATASASKILSGTAISVASLDPMSLLFGLSASLSAFRIPESEIILPAGAELTARTESPIGVDSAFPGPPMLTATAEQLQEFARQLPFRTETAEKHEPSDITSIMFLGSEDEIIRALDAAGWSRSDALGAKSKYSVMRSVVENQGYKEGPVSTLLLGGKPPVGAWSKTLDTFFARHHLRLFAQGRDFEGKSVFVTSATHDSGIGINKSTKTLIHLIDEDVDEERGKVVDDMLLTGCVSGVRYIARPWITGELKNATGDTLQTDRRMAVLSLTTCLNPKRADQPDAELKRVRSEAIAPERVARDGLLYLRDDLFRGNIVYQGYHAGKAGYTFLHNRHNPPTDAAQPKVINLVGEPYTLVSRPKVTFLPKKGELQDPGTEAPSFQLPGEPKSYKTRLQYSISGGYSWFANRDFSTQPLSVFDNADLLGTFNYVQRLHSGYSISVNATINSWRYVSNEFGYNYNSAPLTVSIVDTDTVNPAPTSSLFDAGQVRQFTYNTLLHLRPNGSRFRPYIAAGPSFQLLRLTDSKPTKNPLLSVSVRDVALIVAAYSFGHKPPLEGGGIFQFGFQYGAG